MSSPGATISGCSLKFSLVVGTQERREEKEQSGEDFFTLRMLGLRSWGPLDEKELTNGAAILKAFDLYITA